ncbi:hypothetical protein Efla_001927 [Eimeria flavescens]
MCQRLVRRSLQSLTEPGDRLALRWRRGLPTAAQGLLELLPKRHLISASGPDAAPLLQSLVSQDLLHFAPLLGASTVSALALSGPLTRLQVRDKQKKAEEAAALDFPDPPRSFVLSSSSSESSKLQRLRLWRRPAVAAAFLNPKCRVLADALIVWRDSLDGSPRLLLDVDADVSERVLIYLERHAVSSSFSVSFEQSLSVLHLLPSLSTGLSLHATRPPPAASTAQPGSQGSSKADSLLKQSFVFTRCSGEGLPSFGLLCELEAPGAAATSAPSAAAAAAASRDAAADTAADADGCAEGFIAADPRTWRLGYRVYLGPLSNSRKGSLHAALALQQHTVAPAAGGAAASAGPAPAAAADAVEAEASAAAQQQDGRVHEVYRHLIGVCEGPVEAGVGEQLPLSLNYDFLGLTCSHNKGCFVGQEVLTRALHQLSNRRRVALLLRKPHGPAAASAGDPSRAPPCASGVLEKAALNSSFGACVPSHVVEHWERALRAAADRLLGGLHKQPAAREDTQQVMNRQAVVGGDRVYRQIGGEAPGEGGGWREIGVVLAFDEEVGGGLCLLRSPPTDGPLKSPQEVCAFAAALFDSRLVVCKEKPKELLPAQADSKETQTGFLVVPPPYVIDALLSAPSKIDQ